MSFREKVVWIMLLALVVAYGGYFLSLLDALAAGTVAGDIPYRGAMLGAVVTVVVLVIAGTVAVTVIARGDDSEDERDREIDLRGARFGGVLLAVGALTGMALAMIDAAHFWIANALLLGLVLAEIGAGIFKLVLYRRGV